MLHSVDDNMPVQIEQRPSEMNATQTTQSKIQCLHIYVHRFPFLKVNYKHEPWRLEAGQYGHKSHQCRCHSTWNEHCVGSHRSPRPLVYQPRLLITCA